MGISNILIAILLFSAIILFHELGHFLVAKANKVGVIEFSLEWGRESFLLQKQTREIV